MSALSSPLPLRGLALLGFSLFAVAGFAGEAAKTAAPGRQTTLAAGAWMPLLDTGNRVYPALTLAAAAIKGSDDDREDDDPLRFGDPHGVLGAAIASPRAGCPVTVEISGGPFDPPATITAVLPAAGLVYQLYPRLNCRTDRLGTLPAPAELTFKVTIDGQARPPVIRPVEIQPVNRCVYAYSDSAGVDRDTGWLFAAFVDENDPAIAALVTRDADDPEALRPGNGYHYDEPSVLKGINAVWEALNRRQFVCSGDAVVSTSAPAADRAVLPPGVCLTGKSGDRRSGADLAVLLASALLRGGLEVELIQSPERLLVSVSLDSGRNKVMFLDPALLGRASLAEAAAAGKKYFRASESKFDSNLPGDRDYLIVNLNEARRLGVAPLRLPAAP